MKEYTKPLATVIVIFGAGGDLTWRKLVPALYNLGLNKWLPDRLAIIGVDVKNMTDNAFRQRLRQGLGEVSRSGPAEEVRWQKFAHQIRYLDADINHQSIYDRLAKMLPELEKKWKCSANRIFYLAVPPGLIATIGRGLDKAHLNRAEQRNRIVIEKPFGRDLHSARSLNHLLTRVFTENQIFRIDHYLGKETVQNILAFRFANSLFEPIWNRRYIDHVQLTVGEEVGVEHRGGYYESAGALRDMVQNHLSQVLCLIAMEPPVTYKADEIRNKKVDVLRAMRPIPPEQLGQFVARGQYGAGWVAGQRVVAYRDEDGVRADSNTETYAAIKFFVDNWRWQDVPFYMRTGKRLPARVSEVCIQFNPVPHQSFPSAALMQSQPNRLVIRIQPDEGIMLRFQAKLPGETMRLAPVDMEFSYGKSFRVGSPEAYETLLLDVMLGDATQFMRADQLETSWGIITPILEAWESVTPWDFPNYEAGTWGPEAAEVLIAQDGRSWFSPTAVENSQKQLLLQCATIFKAAGRTESSQIAELLTQSNHEPRRLMGAAGPTSNEPAALSSASIVGGAAVKVGPSRAAPAVPATPKAKRSGKAATVKAAPPRKGSTKKRSVK